MFVQNLQLQFISVIQGIQWIILCIVSNRLITIREATPFTMTFPLYLPLMVEYPYLVVFWPILFYELETQSVIVSNSNNTSCSLLLISVTISYSVLDLRLSIQILLTLILFQNKEIFKKRKSMFLKRKKKLKDLKATNEV